MSMINATDGPLRRVVFSPSTTWPASDANSDFHGILTQWSDFGFRTFIGIEIARTPRGDDGFSDSFARDLKAFLKDADIQVSALVSVGESRAAEVTAQSVPEDLDLLTRSVRDGVAWSGTRPAVIQVHLADGALPDGFSAAATLASETGVPLMVCPSPDDDLARVLDALRAHGVSLDLVAVAAPYDEEAPASRMIGEIEEICAAGAWALVPVPTTNDFQLWLGPDHEHVNDVLKKMRVLRQAMQSSWSARVLPFCDGFAIGLTPSIARDVADETEQKNASRPATAPEVTLSLMAQRGLIGLLQDAGLTDESIDQFLDVNPQRFLGQIGMG